MKNIFLLVIAALIITSCQNDDSSDSSFSMKSTGADYTGYPVAVQTVSGDITTNTTWTNDKVWEIDGIVRVKSGATLTIQAGTFIKAKPLAAGVKTGFLVITRTGKINVEGTLNAPVVFTSYKLLDSNATTSANAGDFGGIVILGDAQTNNGSTTNVAEGFSIYSNVSDFYYGGSNDNHNGGSLNYVRIEFGGMASELDLGVSSLTFAGVGRNTIVDHVQVSYSRDDSYEFIGGKVNASHLVSFASEDDNFDFNLGYTGTITKAVALADINSKHSFLGTAPNLVPDSNGIEIDNNPTGTSTTIFTRPVFSQISIIGVSNPTSANSYENGIHIRRLGQINFTDVTVTGYNKGIYWEPLSVSSSSSWSGISIHGYVNPVYPTTTVLGFGNAISTVNPGTKWSLIQPFFNDGPLDFTGATGAFRTEALWTNTWTKFVNF